MLRIYEGPIYSYLLCQKEKKWELKKQLECNGFYISQLYGAHERQEIINIQSAAIGTRVVFCPEIFVM